jgi:hypothetical protein
VATSVLEAGAIGAILGGTFAAAAFLGRFTLRKLLRTDKPSAGASIGVGLIILAVLAVPVGVVASHFERQRYERRAAEERQKKADFLKALCDERRAKGEVPGAGCELAR